MKGNEKVKEKTLKAKSVWTWCATGALLALAGCGQSGNDGDGGVGGQPPGKLSAEGQIKAGGSSTVGPITSAVAEDFKAQGGAQVTVGISGTGGGFKKFIAGEIDIANASRPIKEDEAKALAAKGRQYIELPVAYDGIALVVNPKNTWAKCLTVAELKKIWDRGSKIDNWSQVRKGFPNQKLKLYGPGTASGTFEYFTEEINGEKNQSRADYTPNEDDNALVQGVSRDVGGLGYFGFAYYEQNKDKLKLVGVDGGKGCVEPDAETISTNTYQPLSRPVFIYVDSKAAERPEIQEFVEFYLTKAQDIIREEGSVPLPDSVYQAALRRFEAKTAGSVYAAKTAKGKTLEQLYGAM